MADRLRLPGPRDVRGTLDEASGGDGDAHGAGGDGAGGDGAGGDVDALVVACPPHPRMGGDRRDTRLRAVSDALVARGIDCLRIDYGPWDEGRGEQADVRTALAWGRDDYARVGLVGYSFGGSVALLAGAEECTDGTPPAAVSALSPASSLAGIDVTDAVEAIACPFQAVYGERDGTVDSVPVAERAREHGGTVETLAADHFFVGQTDRAATLVAEFLSERLPNA